MNNLLNTLFLISYCYFGLHVLGFIWDRVENLIDTFKKDA